MESPGGSDPIQSEILSNDARLPVLRSVRAQMWAEDVLYVARPGLRAIPSGTLAVFAFVLLQAWTMTILLWAIWWPAPRSSGDYAFSFGATAILFGLIALVVALLLRRNPGFLLAILRAPFIRLTVTDRRVLWSLPWAKAPLMEIGRERVLGGILGQVDRHGAGSAALILVPGDPSADIDGNIHFDRLPDVTAFLRAFLPR